MKLTVYENSYKVEPSEKPTFEKDEVLLREPAPAGALHLKPR